MNSLCCVHSPTICPTIISQSTKHLEWPLKRKAKKSEDERHPFIIQTILWENISRVDPYWPTGHAGVPHWSCCREGRRHLCGRVAVGLSCPWGTVVDLRERRAAEDVFSAFNCILHPVPLLRGSAPAFMLRAVLMAPARFPSLPRGPTQTSLFTADRRPSARWNKDGWLQAKRVREGKRAGLCSGICLYIDVGFTVRLKALSFHGISAHLLPNCCQTEAIDSTGLL